MGSGLPKQYLRLNARPLLDVTLDAILAAYPFEQCMVSLHPEDRWWAHTDSASNPLVLTCTGGAQRADSVLAALQALRDRATDNDWVLVHDVARPCLHRDDLRRLIETLGDDPVGGILASPVTDTLKLAGSADGRVESSPDRSRYWRALTPQMFRFGLLFRALEKAVAEGYQVTDESSAMERAGHHPRLVEGRADNLKVTVPEDLAMAAFILRQHELQTQTGQQIQQKEQR